jgi:hypothetical protein
MAERIEVEAVDVDALLALVTASVEESKLADAEALYQEAKMASWRNAAEQIQATA